MAEERSDEAMLGLRPIPSEARGFGRKYKYG